MTDTDGTKISWIVLNSIKGLGPVRIGKLIERFGTPDAVLREKPALLSDVCGAPRDIAAQLADRALVDDARRQIERAGRENIRILTLDDPDYPLYLKQIDAPPPVLFARGRPGVLSRKGIGVVGTRKPTAYGKSAAEMFAREITRAGLTVISGLALGVDTFAHRNCIDEGGETVAVLGCGIDRVYPPVNRELADEIASRGAIVSEFPIGTPPEPFNFPRRNRIISGLSTGVLVVEAGYRSGSLITAGYATRQSRDVYAVPGSIFSEKSAGTFNLIRNGAIPVRTMQDIADAMRGTVRSAPSNGPVQTSLALPAVMLNEKELKILDLLSETPVRMDQLMERAGSPVAEMFDVLLNLELKGAIRQVSGQNYVRV